MPILKIHGIPARYDGQKLEQILFRLKEAVSFAAPELLLEREDITPFFVPDLVPQGLGEEIVVFMLLYPAPERTPERIKRMSDAATEILRGYFKAASIQCYPQLLDRSMSSVLPALKLKVDDTSQCKVCGYGTARMPSPGVYKCVNCGEVGTTCFN